jgi:SAM-dependent methyltransferase
VSASVGKATDEFGRPSLRQRIGAAIFDRAVRSREERLFAKRRRRLLEAARGRVLDVGAGTGANLPHYPRDRVGQLVLLDVHRGMLARARHRAVELGWQVELHEASAQRLPFPDASFDTVVFTHALCTIPDPASALREAHRVLKPGGTLLALEHVRAQDPGLAAWQDRLTPVWKLLASGCHPNRDTRWSIEAAGFVVDWVEEGPDREMRPALIRPQLLALARRPLNAGDLIRSEDHPERSDLKA